jgi:hypothetical protein
MIPKSTEYKVVRKSDRLILAEGSARDMRRLVKSLNKADGGFTHFVGDSPSSRVGDKWPMPQADFDAQEANFKREQLRREWATNNLID